MNSYKTAAPRATMRESSLQPIFWKTLGDHRIVDVITYRSLEHPRQRNRGFQIERCDALGKLNITQKALSIWDTSIFAHLEYSRTICNRRMNEEIWIFCIRSLQKSIALHNTAIDVGTIDVKLLVEDECLMSLNGYNYFAPIILRLQLRTHRMECKDLFF